VIKSCSCFRHSLCSHVGDVLWNSEPNLRRQFSQCFGLAFLVFRKILFGTASAKTYHPKHPQKGPLFVQMEMQIEIRNGREIQFSSIQSHLFLSPIGARTLKIPVPYSPPIVGVYTRTPSHQPIVFGRRGTDHLS